MLELNAISPRRALLALALVVSAILVFRLPIAVFTKVDSLLLALLLILASTLLVRKPLNTFRLKVPRTPLGNVVVVSALSLVALVGVPLLLLTLIATAAGALDHVTREGHLAPVAVLQKSALFSLTAR